MFADWQNFYLVVGGASGALIGLLFVVASLNTAQDRESSLRGASVYLTPIVFHFAVVLVVSAVALAPGISPGIAAVLVGVSALAGLAHAVRIVFSLATRRYVAAHWSDLWCYGAAPGIFYLGLGAAAAGLGLRKAWGEGALACAAMALLLVGIRNAWDLVTWLAPKGGAAPAAPPPPPPPQTA